MRAAVLVEAGRIELEERPIPTPGPGDVLIRVSSVGVCGSDTHYYRHGRVGGFVVEAPLVLGHEAAGTIVGVGESVDPSRIGQRVSIEPQRPDPDSEETRRGHYNLCPHMRFFATPPVDGALCDYVTIGAEFAHPVPDSMSDDAAALCEPLSVGIAAIRKAELDGPGRAVLIAGAGPIGIVVTQLSRAYGATDIVVSDPDRTRRDRALAFGATAVVDPTVEQTDELMVDAFIDASGAAAAVAAGIRAVRPAGRVVLVGSGAETMELPTQLIQNRELVLTGVFRYANTWPTAIALAESGRVDLDAMVTARFPLEKAAEALDSDRIPGSVKSVVTVS
ncbi:NAD(P)-dependent alcohol dehydrogenase [Mycolicibacterium moriokaense]|uniref:Sorbitol dehydrogenase n=1 Tax=Mycolicibacterium moriokaense TaxID=39691 RepID=A0AAD1M4Z0_9MYCO|nr:NAD(P)-dependent alcohol dehydrogenase [Mycolicibacterium moriokaense]MCV7041086.1 NAD(P)-dependent alcohol dehydrogenase [Mycolicibacterium moriokaense]ORB27298.1 NAD(P)-dependent alcohol dehydrogenase [Mycolicibacterium moriokaense]BBX00648.1 sorbitol dehydrogenase [Mycolicibacterium moriokaense]